MLTLDLDVVRAVIYKLFFKRGQPLTDKRYQFVESLKARGREQTSISQHISSLEWPHAKTNWHFSFLEISGFGVFVVRNSGFLLSYSMFYILRENNVSV